MVPFTIAHSDSDSHEQSAELARAILEITDRECSTIEVVGIEPLLVDHVDAESVDRLRNAGVRVDDETLKGTVEATPDVVDAVLSLFSGGLLVARFIDGTGTAIFSRDDTDAESCRLTASEYEALCETVPFELLTRLRPFGESVPVDRFGSIETAGLSAYSIDSASAHAVSDVRSVLEAHLERTERTVETIELFGLLPPLEQVDADSVATLVEQGVTRDGVELVGTVPATPDSIDAVLELLSDALLRVVVRDTSGKPLFVREAPEENFWYVTDVESDRLRESVAVTLEKSTDIAPGRR